MKKIKVSIVIPTWNEKGFALDCLRYVYSQSYKDFEVIMVDNGSTDNTPKEVKKRFPEVNVIQKKKNYGFAEGNNIGVRKAKGEYVVLLNNDTIVEKDWLKELVDFMDKDKSTAIAVSKTYSRYDKKSFTFQYETLNPLGYPITYKFDKKKKNWPFYACACSLIYRRDLVDVPFDKDYFLYAEDTYFSWKIRLMGYQVKLAERSKLKHLGEMTSKKFKSKKNYFMEKNRVMNYIQFYSIKNIIVLFPWMLISMIFHNIYDYQNAPYRIKGYLWNITHLTNVLKKRKKIQKLRKVKDKEFTRYMSFKFFDETSIENKAVRLMTKVINSIFLIYSKLFFI